VKTTLTPTSKAFLIVLQKAGPYFLLELLMPGGTLLALLLYVYQNRASLQSAPAPVRFIGEAVVTVVDNIESAVLPDDIASVWRGRARERDGLEALAFAPTPY